MKTFRIIYEVRNRTNNKPQPMMSQIETLADAIGHYCPDADLIVCVGQRDIPLNVCRDLYGLHEDLLDVMYAVAFDTDCDNVGYPDVLTPEHPEQRTYGLMLTEAQSPPLLVFTTDRDTCYFQTRSLSNQGIVAAADDVTTPVIVPKHEAIGECVSFLLTYLDDLIDQIPAVRDLEDYRVYIKKLRAMEES